MEHKPLPDARSLKDLRIARSLSQDEVAEAIETNANTVSRWEHEAAIPHFIIGVNSQNFFKSIQKSFLQISIMRKEHGP